MKKRVSGVVVYVMIVAIAALALFLNNSQSQDICEKAQEGRQVLRQVVVVATEGSGATDLTGIPGFENLDPETQVFLQNLAVATASNDRPSLTRQRLLDQIPPIDC